MIKAIKNLIKLSPIPLTKNHLYDLQTKRIISRLKKNSNCVDVGCYVGEILDLLIKAAPEGTHFGIEPIPKNYQQLKRKYQHRSNCKILNYAASNLIGKSDFNLVLSNPSYSGLKKRTYDKPNERDTTISVHTELLDNLIPDNLKIDFIKIDVEGAEFQVLEGASKIISRDKPLIVFEHGLGASDVYGTTPEMIFEFFKNKSMKISNLGSWIKNKSTLSQEDFINQYKNRQHYYFIAHP